MSNTEKLKEIEADIDSYGIQMLLMKAEITTTRFAVMELASFLLKKDELSNFRKNYYNTLLEQSNLLCNRPDLPFSKSKALKALFELQEFVDFQLNYLKDED